jgi:glutamyl-tRNA reductase
LTIREPIALQQLTLLGIDYRSAPLALREQVAIADADLPRALDRLKRIAGEAFVLSTCNRTEIYALVDGGDPAGALTGFLASFHAVPVEQIAGVVYSRQGAAAIEHLFRVASGLNSMMLGEPHILAQLRIALDAARTAGTLGPLLSRAGEVAQRTGKRARTETAIARGSSIPHAVLSHLRAILDRDPTGKIVIAGAGQMAGHVARLLRSAGASNLVILNRTERHAEALAHAVGGRAGLLSVLVDELADAAAVISAVSIPDRLLIDREMIAATGAPLLLVDLGVPRSIDPALRNVKRVRLLDIDDLGAEAAPESGSHAADIAAIERMIAEEADGLIAWIDERDVAETIASLRERSEAIRVSELQRALRRLGTLSERERNIVEALSVGLVGKLLHQPVTRLKAERGELTGATQRLFGLPSPERLHIEPTGEAQ